MESHVLTLNKTESILGKVTFAIDASIHQPGQGIKTQH
jgi:hypothetical protein